MHAAKLVSLIALVGLLSVAVAQAEVRLPHIFSSNMVLQRDKEILVWGWAAAGEDVKVQLADRPAVATKAAADGKWMVKLPAMPAGGPVTLKVSGANEIVLENVLIGEVWVASGQSNMEWPLAACENAAAEIAQANYPQLRQVQVPKRPSGYPMDDFEGAWQVCDPNTAGGFTAVGYFFGKYLMDELKVPVGIINTSWGGTAIDPWSPPVGFAQVPTLKGIYNQVMLTDPRSEPYKQTLQDYLGRLTAWEAEAKDALAAEKPLAPAPEYPPALKPLVGPGGPSTLYHGMVEPLLPFAIRGGIWYQGESNHGEGMLYADKMKALVGGWRQVFGQGDFPFYFVQIAPYVYGDENPYVLAEFWEAQEAATKMIPNTGMAVIHDIGNINDIHPKNKLDVGKRLALLALKNTYGQKDLVASGPTCKALAIDGNKLRISFDNLGGGLVARDGKPLSHFEIIDRDEGGFVLADAVIEGDTVVLSAAAVKNPVAMRFGWHKLAEPNLSNKAGLPAGAFRAGDVPKRDYLTMNVAEAKEYELVYSLDLKKASADMKYDLDNRARITQPCDRVAYFVELTTGGDVPKYLYVSMDAFTTEVAKLGLPILGSGIMFQQKVANMNVVSNVQGIVPGTGIATGNIEFWPSNYGPPNSAGIPGASNEVWDFGDQPGPPEDGYGCMQVHNYGAKQTLFSFNNWKASGNADCGIGNSAGANPDWTFAGNLNSYTAANLRVLVRVKK